MKLVAKEFNNKIENVISSKQISDDTGKPHVYIIRILNDIMSKLLDYTFFMPYHRFEVTNIPEIKAKELYDKNGFAFFSGTYNTKQKRKFECFYMNKIAYDILLNQIEYPLKSKLISLNYFEEDKIIVSDFKRLDSYKIENIKKREETWIKEDEEREKLKEMCEKLIKENLELKREVLELNNILNKDNHNTK